MSKDTPMMQQYKAIKAEHPDTLLMYRMGDFYEMFFDDALIASSVLSITLTRRRSSKEGDEGIPMCGVPFHAAEGYIATLVEEGYKVALCEQVETPAEAKARGGAKALVKRDVTRLYTKGTLTEDAMLKADESNYIVSLFSPRTGKLDMAYADISTGECGVKTVSEGMLSTEISQLAPSEVLIPTELEGTLKPFQTSFKFLLSVHDFYFDEMAATDALKAAYNTQSLFSLGLDSDDHIKTFGALVGYATSTNIGKPPKLNAPTKATVADGLKMDAPTRETLELMYTQKGEKKGSVYHTINKTTSAAGARTLASWLQNPLSNAGQIKARQDAIGWLTRHSTALTDIQTHLKSTCDIARALTRLSLGRSGPRDLDMFQKTLANLPALSDALKKSEEAELFSLITKHLSGFEKLQTKLSSALEEDGLPLLARDGGFVKKGFCAELDKYTDLAENGLSLIRNLEEEQKALTGITTLKVKYNKVWGYFLEVSKGQTDKVPEHYIHRQTTTNAQRFSLPELMTLERDLASAETETTRRELEIFEELSDLVLTYTSELSLLANALGTLDALASGAVLARDNHYVCPTVDDSRTFDIKGGRHVVVEQSVKNFIANDTTLSDGKLWLITGPNMAGKSTFLRQNALITLLAHMGLYVPAESAHIGIVDRIFTRLGSGDDLAHGQSTFMVEMVETASIMNNATDRSLILLDEIGRGTATYDGLSIAWACVEHLMTNVKARGLFATHYHELTTLSDTYPDIENHSVSVKEWKNTITFLYKVVEGQAPRSYGIHVAKLAGMPASLTQRADRILNKLEKASGTGKNLSPADLPLFEAQPEPDKQEPSELETQIMALSLDEMTPKQAHDMLYNLKTLAKN
ncbi:MAG: DNA mismatch repair protein MutS [Pseudomonadota bacterium]|nr:DNA mismatch repair protein MutS [Pseudomonadota bacterium]